MTDDLPIPKHFVDPKYPYDPKVSSVLNPCRFAFHYALVGYLALMNLLAIANDHEISDRLLGMSHEEFESWLDRIDEEGSVT